MKAILLRTRAHHCYIIGTNEELTKVLDACSHHTRLSPKPYVFRNGEMVYPNYEIREEEKDKLHVVCLEREFDCIKCELGTNLLYSVMTPSDCWLLPDDAETPDDLYYNMHDDYFGAVICVYGFSVDEISDWLQDVYR